MRSPFGFRSRTTAGRAVVLAMVMALAVPLTNVSADARAGGGFSFGGRGTRSFSLPPATTTAPRSAQPLPRMTDPGSGSSPGFAAPRRSFGFGTGLAAGLLGAGLFGMLTGGGFFGGLGSLASLFGLVLQLAVFGGLIWLALRFFANRAAKPAFAGRSGYTAARSAPDGLGSGSAAQASLAIGPADFTAFERTLGEVQAAHSREDLGALSRLAAPEMVRQFAADIERNRGRGLRNDVSGVTLLQGDLSEAWREPSGDYATVAMRFGARDVMVERASGRVVEGDPNRPVEAVELWTFRRDRGGPWLLSAIQQAA